MIGEFKFMDLLYSKYANPLDLMNSYINRGRFGEFVSNVLEAEYERRKEQVEKDDDMKLWIMYVHCNAEESFYEWKKRVLRSVDNKKSRAVRQIGHNPYGRQYTTGLLGCQEHFGDHDLDDDSISKIIDDLFD